MVIWNGLSQDFPDFSYNKLAQFVGAVLSEKIKKPFRIARNGVFQPRLL